MQALVRFGRQITPGGMRGAAAVCALIGGGLVGQAQGGQQGRKAQGGAGTASSAAGAQGKGAVVPASTGVPRAPRQQQRQLVELSDSKRRVIGQSVDRGLAWLAAQQKESGFFEGLIGKKGGRSRYMPLGKLAAQRVNDTGHVGVTAICGMAFLAGGHLPGRGRYGQVVAKTIDAVLAAMQESGLITMHGSNMYSHAFATLFLAEVYGMSRDPKIKKGLERAVHIVVDCQNAQGAWRYSPFTRESDVSVTVCQLQALRAARNIGIEVPKSVVDKAVAFIKKCRVPYGPAEGRYYYDGTSRRGKRKQSSYSIQAAAVTSLVSAGVYDRELIEPVMDFLERELPKVMRRQPESFFFYYGSYYATQAFYHADIGLKNGGFQKFYELISDHFLDHQQEDGRWLNPAHLGPGDTFGTAVACIVLQVPYQYLPIFQR